MSDLRTTKTRNIVKVILLAAVSCLLQPGVSAANGPDEFQFFIYNPHRANARGQLAGTALLKERWGGLILVGQANRRAIENVVKRGWNAVYLADPSRFDETPRMPESSNHASQPADTDGDGLTDAEEAIYHTDPNNPDTDQDFLSDGDEVHLYGTNPLKESTDGDRYDDGQEVLGFSPSGLGALGGDMPGYVLAPGNLPLVAAYPKIDFQPLDGIEMQAKEVVTIGTKTITTETKTKTTTKRSVDITTVGKESNYINQNQRVDNPQTQAEQQADIDATPPVSVSQVNTEGANKFSEVIRTGGMAKAEASPAQECQFPTACALENVLKPLGEPTPQSAGSTYVSGSDLLREGFTNRFSPIDRGFYHMLNHDGSTVTIYNYINQMRRDQMATDQVVGWLGVLPVVGSLVKNLGDLAKDADAARKGNTILYLLLDDADFLAAEYGHYVDLYHKEIPFNLYMLNCCGELYNTNIRCEKGKACSFHNSCGGSSCRMSKEEFAGIRENQSLPRYYLEVVPGYEADWTNFKNVIIADTAKLQAPKPSQALTVMASGTSDSSQRLTLGPFDYGAHLTKAKSDLGSGMARSLEVNGTILRQQVLFDDPDEKGETSRKISVSQTSLRETVVTEKYSWSVTKEDWQTVTTDSTDFGTVTFSFKVRNTGTDIAQDAAGLRFNLFIGDNPATPEIEGFNPITFPSIENPAITFQNVAPGDESLFGATVHIAKKQFRALDEGASLKIAVADYSYGADELYYRSAAGAGVRFLIDNGVLEPALSRYQEFLVPVFKVWDADLAALREPTYGELLSKAVPVTHTEGILSSINNRAITSTAWWSMMLTKPTDASLFYKSTAVKGQTVRLEYHGDADGDAYADAVEQELGTDLNDGSKHPAPIVIGALYESADPANPGWTIGRFKVTNTGTYEAYGMEARIYATDSTIEITDALVGGSGLVKPGETFDHPDDVFRYRSTSGKKPLLEIRYNDPTGLHILLSNVTLASLADDITPFVAQMVAKSRITAEAPETFFYDVSQRLAVGYANPTSTAVRGAYVVVDWQSLMGDILKHEDRQLDLLPGSNFATFEFKPQDYLSPINIGGRFKALVRVMDHNGALIDSKVAYMTVFPRQADMASDSAPHLALSSSAWFIGSVSKGMRPETVIWLANTGLSRLEVLATTSAAALEVDTTGVLIIESGQSRPLPQRLITGILPAGPWNGSVRLSTNDPTNQSLSIAVSATISEPSQTVSLFPVEGHPWDRRLLVAGDFPAGTTLVFDHDFVDDPAQIVPLYLFESSRQTRLAHGEEVSPMGPGLRRLSTEGKQIALVVPNDLTGQEEYVLQFGKRLQHKLGYSRPIGTSIVLPRTTLSNTTFELWQDQLPLYDDFEGTSVDGNLWTITPGGALVQSGLMKVGLNKYSGNHGDYWASATTNFDLRSVQTSSVVEFKVDSIVFWNNSSYNSATARLRVGTAVIESYTAYSGNPSGKEIPGYLGRLVFDRVNQSVQFLRDGTPVGTYNLAGEASWQVKFEVQTHYDAQEITGWWSLDWVKVHDNSTAWRIASGPSAELLWELPSTLDPTEAFARVIQSPDLSSTLNAQILSMGGSGEAVMPLWVSPSFNGRTILTDFVINEELESSVNLAVSNLDSSPGSPLQGSIATAMATIRNTGVCRAEPFMCSLYEVSGSGQRTLLSTYFVEVGLDPGQEVQVAIPWEVGQRFGTVSLVFRADSGGTLAETEDGDNESSTTIHVRSVPEPSVVCATASVVPNTPSIGQGAVVNLAVANLGEQSASAVALEVFDGDPAAGGLLIGRVDLSVAGGATVPISLPWVPMAAGNHMIFARIVGGPTFVDSDLSNNSCSFGPALVTRPVTSSLVIDCGDAGVTDVLYSTATGYGYIDGSAEVTWGSAPWQSYRYGFGGTVSYRFDNLDQNATYHLDGTFYEGDGTGRTMQVWVDGQDTGARVTLVDPLVHRASVTLPRAAYAADGSVVVEFRRQGAGDALVNELSLHQVTSWYIDCGDNGVTDHAYSLASGHGFLNGSASSAWGASPVQSVRYGLGGDVRYRFAGLDPTKRYRVLAKLYEADGVGRIEQLEVDGTSLGAPVTLSGSSQLISQLVPLAAYSSDHSIDVRIRRTNGSQTVISELTVEEETLPVRSLSGGSVSPAAGTNSTVFTYSVEFTDTAGNIPDQMTVTIDGVVHGMAEASSSDTDTRNGKTYVYLTSGLANGLHSFAFAASISSEAATGDVATHTGPLVGGPGLPDAGAWGNIPSGDTTHPSQVMYAFGAVAKAVRLGFEIYDIDTTNEVEILLNGVSIGFAPISGDSAWGGEQTIVLPLSALRTADGNQLVFRNTLNQPAGSETWGVRNVSLLAERPEGLVVEDVPADNGTALTVRWTLSADDDAGLDNVLSYRVYRTTAPEGPYSLVQTVAAGQALWVDASVACETTYWYRVAAFNGLQDSVVPLQASGSALDNLGPIVTGASPTNGSTGVSPLMPIVLHLLDAGRGVDTTSVDVRLNGAYINPTLGGDPADTLVTIVPSAPLTPGSTATVTVVAGDRATPQNTMSSYSMSFTIGQDAQTPYLLAPSPASGATGVDANTTIAVHVRDDGAGVDTASITMQVNGITITPTLTGSGSDVLVTYDPVSAFQAGQVVTVSVTARDLAPVANAMNASWSFTVATSGEGPAITSSTPTANPVVIAGTSVPFVVTTQDDTFDLTTVTWRVDSSVVKTGTTFNGSGGGDWTAMRQINLTGGTTTYTDEWITATLGTQSTTPADYVVYDDFGSLAPAWLGFNTTPGVGGGTLNITTSSTDLSGTTDTYAFVYRAIAPAGDWSAEVQATCTNNASSDGCGLLVKKDVDTWFFVGQSWDSTLNADAVTFRFQLGGMSMVNLPVAVSASTVYLRAVKTGNLLYAYYRLSPSSAWISLGAAPFFVTSPQVGMAAWETTTTANAAQFGTFRCAASTHLPITTLLTGARDGFSDIRITEENAGLQALVPIKLTDTDYDGAADTVTFPADAIAAGVWKTYRVYYSNPLAVNLSTTTLPGANNFAEPSPTFGTATAVTGSSFTWTATPAGTHTIQAQASDGTYSDFRNWTATVLPTTPMAPTGLQATPDNQKMHLMWQASSLLNVAGYNVYRDSAKVNGALVTFGAFTDVGLTNGVSHCWVVRAVSPGSVESANSNQVCASARDQVAPAPPVGVAVFAGDARARLVWYPSWAADLAGYKVYRRLHGGSSFALLTPSASAPAIYLDQPLVNGTTYDWVVTAIDTAGNESALSAVVTTTPEVQPPVTVSIGDAVVTEGNTGNRPAVFTVTLSRKPDTTVNMNWATAPGSATSGTDFLSGSGTLSFTTNETIKTITVQVVGDTTAEDSEVFYVNLTDASGAEVVDDQGMGTILNDDVGQISAGERSALIDLYNNSAGLNWNVRTNWRNAQDSDFSPTGTECTWFGVSCNLQQTSVEHLDLHDNNLTGVLPSSISGLGNLQILKLGGNHLSGSIPPSLGTLTDLTTLDLSTNGGFSGTIPSELGSLGNLAILDLAGNQLEGTIPATFGNLSALTGLDLSSNRLAGQIPSQLGQLTTLTHLDLSYNLFDAAAIPSLIQGLSNLRLLGLSRTNRTGSVPAWFGSLGQITELYLDGNHLDGAVPSELGNLTNLRHLYLAGNAFTGPLPVSLAALSNLVGSGSDLRWNAVGTTDTDLASFLSTKQRQGGDWQGSQTITPTNIVASVPTGSSVKLNWTPITYTGDSGGYKVLYGTTASGPYNLSGTTINKTAASLTVTGLNPGTRYYFVVQTVTDPHANNLNTVTSDLSTEISVIPPTTYTLTVNRGGSGSGTVVSSPSGIDCGSDCIASFAINTIVSLTPTASADSIFASWGGACLGSGPCEVTMDAAKFVTANFNLKDTATGFNPVTPCRVFDTRESTGDTAGWPIIAGGEHRSFDVVGKCDIPADAKAIVGNVTVVNGSVVGSLSVIAGNLTSTNTTTIEIPLTRARANNAMIQLATDGAGNIMVINNSTGTVNLILDVSGYFR